VEKLETERNTRLAGKIADLWRRFLAFEWTPVRAGVLIGGAVLLSYYVYDPMGMCVG
jgi:hypothetical protein